MSVLTSRHLLVPIFTLGWRQGPVKLFLSPRKTQEHGHAQIPDISGCEIRCTYCYATVVMKPFLCHPDTVYSAKDQQTTLHQKPPLTLTFDQVCQSVKATFGKPLA